MNKRIPSAVPVEAALLQAAPTDDDALCDDIAQSYRQELLSDALEKMSDDDLCDMIKTQMFSDPMLRTALRNMAVMAACNLGKADIQTMMVRFAATAGDSIRSRVDYEQGDDLVSDEAARLRNEK